MVAQGLKMAILSVSHGKEPRARDSLSSLHHSFSYICLDKSSPRMDN